MSLYENVFENNKKWISEHKATDKEFFENLAKGQQPEFLYIGCSDSRVTPEQLTGVGPGDIFVHRNVANVVSSIDINAMSVIEYAVGHLHVKHVVVCGHYFCGGVKAAMQDADLGILNPWLQNIRDVYRTHKAELDAISDEEARYKRLVELNVEEQAFNVMKTAVVQKAMSNGNGPKIHGWVFDIQTGELIDLKIDFDEKFKSYQDIYRLG